MRRAERARFDQLLEGVIDALPAHLRGLLEEAPLIVEDRPDSAILEELGLDPATDVLCGLHSGTPLTERSVMGGDDPEMIHLFREGVVDEAGGWRVGDREDEARVREEIRVTLLHEIGHHFGLDESDLERLGYD